MANLVLQLVILAASHPELVARLVVTDAFAVVFRGAAAIPDDWDVRSILLLRGKEWQML